jgi:DNA repair photolyase
LDQGDNFNDFPGTAHIAQVLLRVEPEVSTALPDMLPELVQAREKLLVSLPLETQGKLRPPESNTTPTPSSTFEEQIEQAEKLSNADKRYQLIVSTILSVSRNEDPEVVLRAIDKIEDAQVRAILKDWLYFNRAQDAIKEKRVEDAETLTSKIEMLEPRAYLRTEIAKELLSASETQSRAREILEQAISEISKAPKSVATIRALFTASNLYLKTDLNRSISVLTTATETASQMDEFNLVTWR